MMKRGVQKLVSFLMILCLVMSVFSASVAQSATADFEALLPLMDLVATSSWHSPNAPEKVPGSEGELSLSFIDAFITLGQIISPEVGVNETMMNDTSAQAALLGKIFAAKLPQLQPAVGEITADAYIGFMPVLVNSGADTQTVQIIGEIYLADKPMREMNEADYPAINWIERAVFTFQSDVEAMNGFRLTGYSVGTDLAIEDAMQGYFDEIAVEYESILGFTILYPSVFSDEVLVEEENGVSATMPDGSASFFAKRFDNNEGAGLSDHVALVASTVANSVCNVYEDMQYGTVAYTTEDGYTVFDVYIVTVDYIYQAQIKYLSTLVSQYGMYNVYIENSFVVNELSQG